MELVACFESRFSSDLDLLASDPDKCLTGNWVSLSAQKKRASGAMNFDNQTECF